MFNLPEPKDDGLLIPEVGEWSKDKHYFLRRYIDAFTTSMKDKWSGLHFIDLFAGAGIERLAQSKELDWGSPMIAAQAPKSFSKLHLCELDKEKYKALEQRIRLKCPNAQILCGDANDCVDELVNEIPNRRTLSLAFLDPYGLHIKLETLIKLKNHRVDLIIFFADRLDAIRNWKAYYLDNPNSSLDQLLGADSEWRKIIPDTAPEKRVQAFRQLYVDRLKKEIGYSEFDYETISAHGRPLYSLLFCSSNQFAVKLWRRISRIKPSGQRTFDF